MRKKEENNNGKLSYILLMIVFSFLITGVVMYCYGKDFRDIFTLSIIIVISTSLVGFSLIQSYLHRTLRNDNKISFGRFAIIFILGMTIGCALPLIPYLSWTIPAIALAFALFSNTSTGIMAYLEILSLCVYLSSADFMDFILYFVCGMMFIILFEKIDEDYRTGAPFFVSMLIYIVALFSDKIFRNSGFISLEVIMTAVINIFITFVFTFAILRFFFICGIDKEKDRFLRLNDKENELILKYKELDKDVYYNAIHTAYFAEKTARLLNMDVDVAKTGAFYHKIVVAECKEQDKSLEEICRIYKFPTKAVRLLQEISYKSQPLIMRESVVVYLADSVISSIAYLITKDKETNDNKTESVDFSKLSTAIIKKKIDSGVLNKSEISFADLIEINKIYTGEKEYYDILRRE